MVTSKKPFLALCLATALIVGITRPSFAILDKTRFAAHLGVAFFAFHHWVYNPYKAGEFAAGSPHRTKTIIKGGAALLFAVHEVKAAENVAHKSKSPLLQKLVKPVDDMSAAFSSIGQKFKSGKGADSDVTALNSSVGAVGVGAAAAGAPVRDVPVAIPGM